ncbi:MAG: ADP-ribose pyrophosphatase [Verrucomicrobiota bacterium]|jgi:ADP-ribose pyrophosphatase
MTREMASESEGWEIVSSETRFKDDHLTVATEKIRSPERPNARTWTVVHRKRAVVIAAMTPEGDIILIRQERLPIRATIWEVPAGQIDDAKETDQSAIEAVALRELREETGYELAEGGELTPLGDYFTSPGMTDERCYFFLARPVCASASGHAHAEAESILDCRAFSPRELSRMIGQNEIRDANTLAVCARLAARGLILLGRE